MLHYRFTVDEALVVLTHAFEACSPLTGGLHAGNVRVHAHLRPAVPTFVRLDHPHRPVCPAGPTGPYRPLSHSLSQTLVCFYYPSLLGTLNSP